MSLPKPYYEQDGIVIYHGDCLEILPGLDVSAIITDEPYGIASGSAFVRGAGREIASGDAKWNLLVDWLPLAAGCLSPGGYVAFFRDFRRDIEWPEGVGPWSRFHWVKPAPAPCPRKAFMSAVEVAEIGVRAGGTRGWWGGGATPNTWTGLSPARLGRGHGHPCEKPVDLMRVLVRCLSGPGQVVLDPFAGVGTTLRAAKDEGRKAIGIEIEERYCEIAANRLAQGVLAFGDGGAS